MMHILLLNAFIVAVLAVASAQTNGTYVIPFEYPLFKQVSDTTIHNFVYGKCNTADNFSAMIDGVKI